MGRSTDTSLRRRPARRLGFSLVAAASLCVGVAPGSARSRIPGSQPSSGQIVRGAQPKLGRAGTPTKRKKQAVASLTKAGVATTNYGWNNPGLLRSIGARWAFDGQPDVTPHGSPITWIPEVQNQSMLTPTVIASLQGAHQNGAAKYLLTFNEPDNVHQSYMSPAEAASLWPQLESTGLELGSPATDWTGDGWLAQFMRIAKQRHLRVNFITLHYYQDFTSPNAVASLRSRLVNVYHAYHKPLWITEIGTEDIEDWGEHMTQTPTEALAARYTRQVLTMLNRLAVVQRYSWYTDTCSSTPACPLSSLFTPGGGLTAVGQAFKQVDAG